MQFLGDLILCEDIRFSQLIDLKKRIHVMSFNQEFLTLARVTLWQHISAVVLFYIIRRKSVSISSLSCVCKETLYTFEIICGGFVVSVFCAAYHVG